MSIMNSASNDNERIARAVVRARQQFVETRKARGEQTFLQHNHNHVCHENCKFYEVSVGQERNMAGNGIGNVRSVFPPLYVCEFSLCVHVCGAKCNQRVELPRREGHVCRFTGMVLPMMCEDFVREISRTGCDESSGGARSRTRVLGPTYTRMGTGSANKRSYIPKTANLGKQIAIIYEHVRTILCGPDRVAMYKTQLSRFDKEVQKTIKGILVGTDGTAALDLVDVSRKTLAIRKRFGYFLNPPALNLNKSVLMSIAKAFYDYLQRALR